MKGSNWRAMLRRHGYAATRSAIIAGAFSPALQSLIAEAVAIEQAEAQLEAVAGPDHYVEWRAEADRLMTVASIPVPGSPPMLRSPTLPEALDMVIRRVCAGS